MVPGTNGRVLSLVVLAFVGTALTCSTDVEYLRSGWGESGGTAGAGAGTGGAGGGEPGGAGGASGSVTTAGASGAGGTSGGTGGTPGADGGDASDGGSDRGDGDAAPDEDVADVTRIVDAAVCAPGACKRVFVSSNVPASSAKLGGIAGGDTFCQTAANDAKLGGTWKAWLSDATGSPSVRFTHSTVPYMLLDGNVVAADWTALTKPMIAHTINVTETGLVYDGANVLEVWTGTTSGGVYSGSSCANWTNDTGSTPYATVGLSNQTGIGWTEQFLQFCNRTTMHLYCFEQ
jgi:hypothetical protein